MEVDLATLKYILSLRKIVHLNQVIISRAKEYFLNEKDLISMSKKDILGLAKKLNQRKMVIKSQDVAERWMWREQKMFVFIVIYFAEAKQININDITPEQFQIIRRLFPLKEETFLRYEYILAFNKNTSDRPVWNQEETQILERVLAQQTEENQWKAISYQLFKISGQRFFKSGGSCRNRWENHTNPTINKGSWSKEEDIKVITAILERGTKWANIAKQVSMRRTEHMIKNRYRCLVKKFGINLKKNSTEQACSELLRILNSNRQRKLDKMAKEISRLERQQRKIMQAQSVVKPQHSICAGSQNQITSNQSRGEEVKGEGNLSIDDLISSMNLWEFGNNYRYMDSLGDQWLERLIEVEGLEMGEIIDLECF